MNISKIYDWLNKKLGKDIIEESFIPDLNILQKKITYLIYYATIILGFPALIASLLRYEYLGWGNAFFIQIGAYLFILITGIFFLHKISYKILMPICLTLVFLVGTSGLIKFGIFETSMSFMILFSVLATIYYKARYGFLGIIMNLFILIAIFILVENKIIIYPKEYGDLVYSKSLWIDHIVTFILLSTLTVLTLGFLYKNLVETIGKLVIKQTELRTINAKISIEIEERKKIEIALKESEEKYRNYIESSPNIVYILDNDGNFVDINPAGIALMGYEKSFFINKHFGEIIVKEDLPKAQLYFKLASENHQTNGELRFYKSNGSILFLEFNAVKLSDDKHLGFCTDITLKKQAELQLVQKNKELFDAEEKLRIANEKLILANIELKRKNEELTKAKLQAEESDKLKSAFLANMSHEIRTPMNSIVGFSGLLRKENLNTEKKKKYINLINSSAKQLLNLISDIIDLSKIELNQLMINYSKFNLNKFLDEILLQFEISKSNSDKSHINLYLRKELDEDKSEIFSDDLRLRQILSNLINNSIKFTEKGFVQFGYQVIENQNKLFLKFYVKDTGIGIVEEKQHIIFDRFRQIEEYLNRKFGGTGLGLSISRGLVELFHGNIWLESTPGKGTSFYFTIPYKKENATYNTMEIDNTSITDTNLIGYNILIVEDDPINYDYLKEVLEETKVNIIHERDGQEAIKICCDPDSIINLVLMDIQLPNLNGLEATRQIKAKRKDLPIIAQTAYAMVGDEAKCMEAGCDDYVAKPIDENIIIEKVVRLIKKL